MNTRMQQDFFIDRLENHATIVQPGEGARVTAGEGSCTFKVTTDMSNGRLGIYEIVVPSHTPGQDYIITGSWMKFLW